jgi:hypothetical protein
MNKKFNHMKKIVLTLSTCISFVSLSLAQIPNAGFENWTSAGSYNTPDKWSNLNPTTAPASVYTCVKGTPGNPGSSYINLTSKTVLTAVAPGVAVSGRINTSTYKADRGFPCTMQPSTLTGNWQYMAMGADQGYISVLLTKWNSSMMMEDTVAYTIHPLAGMVMSWASFNIPITYRSGAMPDSALIVLSASGKTPVNNSMLYVDNLSFTGSAAGISEIGNAVSQLNAYPIPAKDQLNVEFSTGNSESLKIQMIDVLGNVIFEKTPAASSGEIKESINTASFSKGVYFLRILSNSGSSIRKIIIN